MADDGSASPADVPTPGDEVEGLLPEAADRPAEPPNQPAGQPVSGAPNAEEAAAAASLLVLASAAALCLASLSLAVLALGAARRRQREREELAAFKANYAPMLSENEQA